MVTRVGRVIRWRGRGLSRPDREWLTKRREPTSFEYAGRAPGSSVGMIFEVRSVSWVTAVDINLNRIKKAFVLRLPGQHFDGARRLRWSWGDDAAREALRSTTGNAIMEAARKAGAVSVPSEEAPYRIELEKRQGLAAQRRVHSPISPRRVHRSGSARRGCRAQKDLRKTDPGYGYTFADTPASWRRRLQRPERSRFHRCRQCPRLR